MAEVEVRVRGGLMTGAAGWARSITLPEPEATKVVEWLQDMLPQLVVQAKSGISYRIEVSKKD